MKPAFTLMIYEYHHHHHHYYYCPPLLSVLLALVCSVATVDKRRAAAVESTIMKDQCMMSSLQGVFTNISCHVNVTEVRFSSVYMD